MNPERVLKSIEAENIALTLCNPAYVDCFADSIAMRNCNNIRDRWQFADSYIQQLRRISPYLEKNTFFKEDKRNYARVQTYYNLPSKPMPEIVYIDGFSKIDKVFYEMVQTKSFWGNATITILDENKCDFSDLLEYELFDTGNYSFLSKYIALKHIYKYGGIYIGEDIELEATLNYLRYFKIFFAYIDNYNLSDDIFGGMAGNAVLLTFIDAIKNHYDNEKSMAEIIKSVLKINMRIPIDGKTHLYDYEVTLFSKHVFAYDDGANLHIASHNFKRKKNDSEYVTVKRTTLMK